MDSWIDWMPRAQHFLLELTCLICLVLTIGLVIGRKLRDFRPNRCESETQIRGPRLPKLDLSIHIDLHSSSQQKTPELDESHMLRPDSSLKTHPEALIKNGRKH